MKVLQFPLVRITLFFILGILFVYFLKLSPAVIFIFFTITTIVFCATYFITKKKTNFPFLFGIATYLFAFSIGATTQLVHSDLYQPNNYIHSKEVFTKNHVFTVTLREKLKSSYSNERYIALLNSIDQEKSSGRILLNIRSGSLNHSFAIGSRLKINAILYETTPQKNPNQFDYQKYLENKQIYAQLYTDSNEIKLSSDAVQDIWYYAAQLRTRIIQNLEKSNFNRKELNVAVALIMGQQQDIDPEIIQDYQYAGAVHILSVSGLHIGFILLFVTQLLKPFPNTKKGALIKLIITLTALFLFGILAGLAPSVVRSVAMFSFVAIGNHLRRSVNIYHTLLVSVLLILLFQPSFLFDVGFQLSYVALFFIIWMQPLIDKLWKPKNKIQKYVWDILTVSFAAQIGTLPLSVYYFHQFPMLFFVTNLIVIPFLSIIMALGVFVMVLAAFNYVPFYPAKLLELCICFLDKIINTIGSLEQFVIKDIPLNLSLLLSGYLLLITIILWFKKPSFKRLACALLVIIVFQLTSIKTKWDIQRQDELVIYNTKNNTLITERIGDKVTLYSNDCQVKDSKSITLLKSYLTGNFSHLNRQIGLQNLVYFKGKKILILDSSTVYPKSAHPDIVLLTQSTKINLDRFLQNIKPKIVIADGSNFKTVQKFWKTSCNQKKIPFHATNEKGFYKIN